VPEGHTIRRQAKEFAAGFAGDEVVVSSPQGRFEAGAALLDGHELVRAEAAGKHLFLRFSNGRYLHVHLGLIGKWNFGPPPAPAPVGAVRVRLEGPRAWADLRGATLCEVVTPAQVRDVLARLGPDPLRRDGRREEFVRRVGRRVLPIAALLMDQEVIAGVGNVYRAEVLFRARLSPDVPGRELDPEVVGALWDDLSVLMRDGVKRGVIVTTLPADRPPGTRRGVPPREAAHYAYKRTGLPCRICGTPIATRELNGRNLYWCPTCQAG
jgi:endonuclease VIII